MVDLKALIAKARTEVETAEPVVVPVEIAGQLVDIGFRPIWGQEWAAITAAHPVRQNSQVDKNLGFNSDAVAEDYPLDRLTVDGEEVDSETWRAVLGVLSGPALKMVAAALYGINMTDPMTRVVALGKARAGAQSKKRPSPASSGSRKGASTAGSPQK